MSAERERLRERIAAELYAMLRIAEREHLTERAFDLADGLSDALWGGERGWEGRSAEQTLRVLRERLRASEPAEAETYTLEEIMDMLRPEYPDAVKALRRRAESREGEER